MQPTPYCNLDCTYCYLPGRARRAIMSPAVLDAALSCLLRSDRAAQQLELLWHAGEPLSAGLPFFRRAVELIHRHNVESRQIVNSIQTNGVLIDKDWCRFFAENDFRIGISIDGPAYLHDKHRVNWAGRGTHKRTLEGCRLLRRSGIEPGALCVLTRDSLDHPDDIYNFFLAENLLAVGFNPEEVESANSKTSLCCAGVDSTLSKYKAFFSRILELHVSSNPTIRIREFDMLAAALLLKRKTPRSYWRPAEVIAGGILTIQYGGEVTGFSPEFAGWNHPSYPTIVLGNVLTDSLDTILSRLASSSIAHDVRRSVALCADSCKWFDLCGGRFLTNKLAENGTLLSSETIACRHHLQAIGEVFLEFMRKSGGGREA